MAKSKKRDKIMANKRQRKLSAMKNSGKQSKYARKKVYLHKHGLWGFEVPSPKPWGSGD